MPLSRFPRWLLGTLLLAMLALPAPEVFGQQVNCSEELVEAQNSYDRGRFDDSINRINRCLERDTWTDEERRRAYRLMGLSYLGKDLEDDARSTVTKLLELVPNYEADPAEDPPAFVRMVEEVRAAEREAEQSPIVDNPSVVEQPAVDETPVDRSPPPPIVVQEPPRQSRGIGRWLLIGGGVVGAGILAAVLLGGGGGGENGPGQIPGPPPLPN